MVDLIDREQALNCFHCWVDKYGDVHTPDEIAAYREIEALPAVEPKPQWVPVWKRLPEDGQWCLATYKCCDGCLYMCVCKYLIVHYGKGHKGMWCVSEYRDNKYYISDEVTAWMPILDPYGVNADREEERHD